jgi:hypothetical protein
MIEGNCFRQAVARGIKSDVRRVDNTIRGRAWEQPPQCKPLVSQRIALPAGPMQQTEGSGVSQINLPASPETAARAHRQLEIISHR